MKRRKMSKKMNNKGFTLVELIVVLVILAILAAILVPTLMGYIDKAKQEKDFSTAQSVRVAVQSVLAELYSKSEDPNSVTGAKEGTVLGLIGAGSDNKLDGKTIDIDSVSFAKKYDKDKVDKDMYQLTGITVKIEDSYYTYTSTSNTWEASTTAPSTNTTP